MINWFTISITYILAWWFALFLLLPIKSNPPEKPGEGHSAGAPEKTYLKQKLLGATVLAASLTIGFFLFLRSGILQP